MVTIQASIGQYRPVQASTDQYRPVQATVVVGTGRVAHTGPLKQNQPNYFHNCNHMATQPPTHHNHHTSPPYYDLTIKATPLAKSSVISIEKRITNQLFYCAMIDNKSGIVLDIANKLL